ncbi:MAG TPA: ABC transporter substrate-binding protein [Actinopolymorphaceae bacterium]
MRVGRLAVMAVAAGSLVAAAACGSPSKGDGDQTDKGGQPKSTLATYANSQDPKATGPAADVPGAKKGGTLTVLSSSKPHTFDPTRAYYLDVMSILKLVTRGLTQTKYVDGKPVLVPDLATDLGRPSENFTRWEFTLRDGVKYEDGTPVKVEDLAWAIKRQMATTELPDGPTYGLDYYLDGDKYKGPWVSGKDFKAVETPDDKTLIVKMRRPFPSFQYYASLPAFTPIPEAKDTKQDYENHVLATGPYMFEKYEKSRTVVLKKNPHWDPKTDPGRHQYVDKFEFRFGLDDVTLQKRIVADKDEDQRSLTYNGLLGTVYQAMRGTEAEKRLVKGPSSCSGYMWFDVRKIPMQVRRAISLAWDFDADNKASEEIPGITWYPSTTITPSITPGWLDFDVMGTGGKGTGNPKAARKLLKEAGKEGFELSFYYASDDNIARKVAEVRRVNLEEAGFKVKAIPAPSSQMRKLTRNSNAPVNLRQTSWCIDWANPDSVLPAIIDGRKAMLPGGPVPSYLNVEPVTKEIDRIMGLPAQKALPEWGKLDKMIMEKYLPVIPIGQGGVSLLHGSKVRNVVVDQILSMPDYTQIWVEP